MTDIPFPTPGDLAAAQTLWDYHCIYLPPGEADAIIGLGSYDLRVADRCAQLHADGLAPVVLFAGGSGNWTAGRYATSEAAAFAHRAIDAGLPRDAILLEERSANIGENLRFAAAVLPAARRVILVTKPQTQRRCLATAQRQWPEIEPIVTAPLHELREQPVEGHDMAALICEMVGDVRRMETYPGLGFQSEQPLDEAVRTACDHLIGRGFTAHLPADHG